MWKRHAGFDVVTWAGTNSSVVRKHNLGRTPEMIWYKNRSGTRDWVVYHKGLNDGTNPQNYVIKLNETDKEASNTSYMTGTAPTSTTFVSGNDDDTNGSGDNYIAMLFASISGISKLGYYDGSTDTYTPVTVTTGFSPRIVIIKRANTIDGGTYAGDWMGFDTVRGFSAGSGDADCYLKLNNNEAQNCNDDWGYPTSTGFVIATNNQTGGNGGKYIYWAHA